MSLSDDINIGEVLPPLHESLQAFIGNQYAPSVPGMMTSSRVRILVEINNKNGWFKEVSSVYSWMYMTL